MSTNPPENGRRKVVVAPILDNGSLSIGRNVPIWIASAVIHLGILGLFYFLCELVPSMVPSAWGGGPESLAEEVATTTQVEEQPKEFDLSNTNMGIDDQMELGYNNDRIEDVAVPGMVDPTQSAGVQGAPEDAARSSVPLPPGTGSGLGGAPKLDEGLALGGNSIAGGVGGINLGNQFLGRSAATREKMLNEGGGNKQSEAVVAMGLEWLALHQATDGFWSLHEFPQHARDKPRPAGTVRPCNCEPGTTQRNDIAATGMGLLPFLAAGITQRPVKNAKKDYSKVVEGALNFLMRKQAKDGAYSGDMYAHGIATIAMCEAYGLTSDPKIKISAQRALNFIAYAQDPAGGGWRYAPKQAGDLSVTGWQLMALKSGQMAGLSVSRNVLKASERYLDSVESPTKKGNYRYMSDSGESVTMTSVGLLCRQYSGVNARNPGLLGGVQVLRANPPGRTNNIYYEYYATQVMHHMQGEDWNFWNLGPNGDGKGGIRDTLIAKRDVGTTPKRPHQAGSWPGSQGGRLMATSLSLLCLEVYYRHLPLYRRDLALQKEGK
jgi:hypothetical protein